LRNVVAAFDELDVRALVTVGPAIDPTIFSQAPANIVVVRSAPHGQVLKQASVCVTHCGHGTTLKALAAGVPLVCIPMGRDQNDTAARVTALGAGVRLKPSATPTQIRHAIRAVLEGPYRKAAEKLAAAIAQESQTFDVARDIDDCRAKILPHPVTGTQRVRIGDLQFLKKLKQTRCQEIIAACRLFPRLSIFLFVVVSRLIRTGRSMVAVDSRANFSVEVFEAGPSVGGLAKSLDLWNQRVDLGPQRFFSSDIRVNQLWLDVVGAR
jgi:hypothetical protein